MEFICQNMKFMVFLWTDRMNLYDEKYGYLKK
ncbi:unknown [Paraprevotella clara CAG:116]|nr:unknown [Paraprevotella clara CAG:116]